MPGLAAIRYNDAPDFLQLRSDHSRICWLRCAEENTHRSHDHPRATAKRPSSIAAVQELEFATVLYIDNTPSDDQKRKKASHLHSLSTDSLAFELV